MTNKVKYIPKREYTFDEMGKFIFQKSFENSKGVGINIMLIEKMMGDFEATWDADTDKFNIIVIDKVLNLNFDGDEIREYFKITPVFS